MTSEPVSALDLPPLRGNPFDHRPIESARAQDLVGRDPLMTRLREHIISESPRMILLVGEGGSGRTSLVNALSSQVSKRFVGKVWPQDEPVISVISEIAVGLTGSFDVPASTEQMCERLIDTLEQGTGPLPLVVLDYPDTVPMNDFLARMSPVLQSLRALVIVTLTPGQLASLEEEVLGEFAPPEHLGGLPESQIQRLVDNLMRRKARERWILKPVLLSAIYGKSGGNPRAVVRTCRDLVDERRGVGSEGSLERLVGWQKIHVTIEGGRTEEKSTYIQSTKQAKRIYTTFRDSIGEQPKPDDWDSSPPERLPAPPAAPEQDPEPQFWAQHFVQEERDIEPEDMWENEPEPESESQSDEFDWDEEIPEPDDIWVDEPEPEPTPSEENQETLDSFVVAEEAPVPVPTFAGGLSGLASRSLRTSAALPKGPDDTSIIVAENRPQLTPAPIRPPPGPDLEPAFVTEAKPDTSIPPTEDQPVMAAEGALWTVDPSLGSTLPDLDAEPKASPEPVFDIEHAPVPPVTVPEPVFEEPEPAPPSPPRIPISLGPAWDADEPLNRARAATISDAERTVLSVAQEREVSPSDSELQALLEVGRTRLSQIFNGLRKAGLLSVRKQGRTRLFKLSRAASLELEMT